MNERRKREEAWARLFPAAVSVKIDPAANLDDAHALLPAARQLFHRAYHLHQTGQPVVKLFQPGTDGSLIYAHIHGPIRAVYIQPGPRPTPIERKEEKKVEIEPFACPDVLSGVVHPGTEVLVSAPGETPRYSVHEFHPSPISADTYQLNFRWQDLERLGVESDPDVSNETLQVRYPKPSQYSGAMKRVVQALYGIGKTHYIDETGVKPQYAYFEAQNHYHYRWLKSDGILKFNGEYWLIRISKADGALAMRLELFECSQNGAFAAALQDIGDTETARIATEFGGLPTGKTFPSDINAAVVSGSVLRLLTPTQILPFYRDESLGIDKNSFFAGCGWAFSDSGATLEAHNTCWWYSRPDIVALPFKTWATDGYADASPFDRYMRAEHWKVAFIFSSDAEGRISATATLELVDEQPLEAPNSWQLIDQDGSGPDFELPRMGHIPVTGSRGVAGDPPSLYYPVSADNDAITHGMLHASGMDWSRFPSSFTPALRGGGASAAQADWLCHSSFMAVPRDDNSDRLDRFKFWGRSQSGIRQIDIETAYEAPVLVFYVGEELEIVKRKADRYLSDRETEAYIDVTPGTYYPGDFFGTSLNLLDPVRTSVTTGAGSVALINLVGLYTGTPQFAAVGLIVPAGCREGYVFVKVVADSSVSTVGAETTTYTGFFADLGVVDLREYESDHSDTYTVPNFGTFAIGKYELSVLPGWWSMWTNTFFDWNLGLSPIGVRFAASISAFSDNQALHDEPQLGWRLLDVPFTYRLSLAYPTSNSLPGLAAEYRYTLPGGIELTNANPTEVTFVGGV